MGIMAGIGTDLPKHEYGYNHYPEPQVAKLIYGGTKSALESAAPLVPCQLIRQIGALSLSSP